VYVPITDLLITERNLIVRLEPHERHSGR